MKSANFISIAILSVVMAGCGGEKKSTHELIEVDVKKSYPKKELILQDVFDVEYILLDDTNDEFISNGMIMHLGNELILARNFSPDIIFIFERNGTGIRKINHKGQGPEEYSRLNWASLDEYNNEIYVFSSLEKKVLVYDLFGTFKRRFVDERLNPISNISNFDRENLLCTIVIDDVNDDRRNRFVIISKRDGSVTKEFEIPYKEKKYEWRFDDSSPSGFADGPKNKIFIPNREGWILTEISSDTIYKLLPDYSLIPFIVRTPSVQSMDPEVYLYPSVLTSRYCFMQAVNKFGIRQETGGRKFERRDLMYDREEKALYEYVVYNDDFSTKNQVKLAYEGRHMPFLYHDIAFTIKLESFELVEAYKKGELKGQLKEIAAKLNEESNPVILLAKYK